MKTTDFQNGILIVLCLTLCNTVLVTAYEKMMFGCDNRNLTLRCRKPSYPIINLKEAVVKILSTSRKDVCPASHPNAAPQDRSNCGKENVLRFIQSKCDRKRLRCTLLVRSKEIGDHCEGVLNLRVIYKCMANPTTPKRANARTTNATSTYVPPVPTKQLTVFNSTEKPRTLGMEYKATILLPSLSVEIPNHESTFPDNILAAKVTPRFETSQILRLHTATKHKFPAPPRTEEDWGNKLDQVSQPSTRLKTSFLKTRAKPEPTSSQIIQNSELKAAPKILTTPRVQKGQNNASRLSSPVFLGKLAFVCIWFTTMMFNI